MVVLRISFSISYAPFGLELAVILDRQIIVVIAHLDDLFEHLRDGAGAVLDTNLPQAGNTQQTVGV